MWVDAAVGEEDGAEVTSALLMQGDSEFHRQRERDQIERVRLIGGCEK